MRTYEIVANLRFKSYNFRNFNDRIVPFTDCEREINFSYLIEIIAVVCNPKILSEFYNHGIYYNIYSIY